MKCDIEKYIESFEHKDMLYEVYHALEDVLPDCEQVISWQMPTFKRKRNIIHFAGMKNHIGIYPGSEAIVHFEEELKQRKLKYSKGSIQIPYKQPLPLDFIVEIAKWCNQR